MQTARLGIAYLAEGMTEYGVRIRVALQWLDWQTAPYVENWMATSSPPGSPSEGDSYLLPSSPSGSWTGKGGMVARYLEGDWRFANLFPGVRLFDRTAQVYRIMTNDSPVTWTAIALHVGSGSLAEDSTGFSSTPTQSQVQTFADSVDSGLLDVLRNSGQINPS